MTKTAKSRWGKKRVPIEIPPAFNDEQTKYFAALLGMSGQESVTTLQERLNDAAVYYRLFKDADSWEKPRELRKAIDEVHQLVCELCLRMIDLPDLTQTALEFSCSPSRFDYEKDFPDGKIKLKRDISHLERLRSSIVHARDLIPKDVGGRPDLGAAKFTAGKLAAVYEEFTGETFQVSTKRGRDAPARFVEDALKIIAPEATDANIRTARQDAVRVLQKQRRNQKPPRKRG